MRWAFCGTFLVCYGAVFGAAPYAQLGVSDAERHRFEVASIKVNSDGGLESHIDFQPSGRLVAINMTVRGLIIEAYDRFEYLKSWEMGAAPAWIDKVRFDVVATAAQEGVSGTAEGSQTTRARLRSLLADRFGLRIHTETADRQRYALVRRRPADRLDPRIRPSVLNCPQVKDANTIDDRDPRCRARMPSMRNGVFTAQFVGVTMARFSQQLSALVKVPVVDRTEIQGTFDIELTYGNQPDLPPVATSLQDLGLKLEPEKYTREVLLIDQVAMPSPD